ncbi:MAG: TlyA family RNA methyltransferase [Acidobacteria bacterium]|nr:TlyA family RNA methyltransferase [Acidobacteriota bacterium]MBI3663287.1 TlyA family RNA methyltransferase [Acidobacteriota bacterium]
MKTPRKRKTRLDVLLVERGLVESRQKAQALILAGQVLVNGQKTAKAGALVADDAAVEISGEKLKYASRGGLKLEGALEDFGVSVSGKICLDAGASTGGFTDCLLQRGAAKVFAVDVSTDQLDWKLRQDARVVPVECNARFLQPEDIGEAVDVVTVDVSFISVTKVLPALVAVARPGANFLILVKPQFELERKDVRRGGIVRDPMLHQRAIERVQVAAGLTELTVLGSKPSRLTGAEGNQEYFLHARREPESSVVSPEQPVE